MLRALSVGLLQCRHLCPLHCQLHCPNSCLSRSTPLIGGGGDSSERRRAFTVLNTFGTLFSSFNLFPSSKLKHKQSDEEKWVSDFVLCRFLLIFFFFFFLYSSENQKRYVLSCFDCLIAFILFFILRLKKKFLSYLCNNRL